MTRFASMEPLSMTERWAPTSVQSDVLPCMTSSGRWPDVQRPPIETLEPASQTIILTEPLANLTGSVDRLRHGARLVKMQFLPAAQQMTGCGL